MSFSTNIDTPSEVEQASPRPSIFPVLTPYYAELLAALGSLIDTVACDSAEIKEIKESIGVFAESLRSNAHVAYMEPRKEGIMAVIPLLVLTCDTYGHLKGFESGTAAPGYEPQANGSTEDGSIARPPS
ncbi:hypothetical protein DL771_002180 [Monosporascus sp. 5C6A]|nr:hypothetical protein DL771_002180 [Monosporascus sp. 5C6A]